MAQQVAEAEADGVPVVGIDAIGLLESFLVNHCHRTVAVTAPEELRVKRIMAREGISEEYARLRVAAQKPSAWFQERCDDTLESTEADTVETFGPTGPGALYEYLTGGMISMEEKKEQTPAQKLREELFFAPQNGYDRLEAGEGEKIQTYCEGYKTFLDAGKTERECVDYAIVKAQAAGFRPLVRGEKLQPGDKVYRNNRGKSLLLAVIGQEGLDQGAVIGAAHIDSPRLDLKPNPLYEDEELAYFKTHYYGGITQVPVGDHPPGAPRRGGALKDGTTVAVSHRRRTPAIPSSPWTDLLPHLGRGPGQEAPGEAIVSGEQPQPAAWAAAPLTTRQAATG